MGSSKKPQEWCCQCLGLLLHQTYQLHPLLLKKLHSIVTGTVQGYAHHALVAVRESVKGVKGVVKTVARLLVEVAVVKDVKDVVMQCVKVIASLNVRLPATVYVGDRA